MHKAVNMLFLVSFSKVQHLSNNFPLKHSYLHWNVRTKLRANTYPRFFNFVFLEKIVAFLLFAGEKGDYIDVWMIKIMIKTNQSDLHVFFVEM